MGTTTRGLRMAKADPKDIVFVQHYALRHGHLINYLN